VHLWAECGPARRGDSLKLFSRLCRLTCLLGLGYCLQDRRSRAKLGSSPRAQRSARSSSQHRDRCGSSIPQAVSFVSRVLKRDNRGCRLCLDTLRLSFTGDSLSQHEIFENEPPLACRKWGAALPAGNLSRSGLQSGFYFNKFIKRFAVRTEIRRHQTTPRSTDVPLPTSYAPYDWL
jgi:hypothetical protein